MNEMKMFKMRAWDCFNAVYYYSGDTFESMMSFLNTCKKVHEGGNGLVFERYTGKNDATKWTDLSLEERMKFAIYKGFGNSHYMVQKSKSMWSGKEIYEGDLVKSVGSVCPKCGVIGSVPVKDEFKIVWNENDSSFETIDSSGDIYISPDDWSNELVVFGSIHGEEDV